MTKQEFISRLKENKQEFKDVGELLEYQLPVLQYYLEHYQAPIWDETMSRMVVDYSKITITPSVSPRSLQLMQHFFKGLTNRIKEFEDATI